MNDLLPLGRAVHRCGLVLRAVDAGNGGQIQYRGVARVFPHAAQGQDVGPVFRLVIPVDGRSRSRLLGPDDHAVGGIQKREQEVRRHHPAQKIREEHQGLIGLGQKLTGQFAHHDGEGHGQQQTHHDPQRVVAQRIADHHPAFRGKQEAEIFQPHPFTMEQIDREGDLPGRQLVIQKGHDNTAHRQIAQQQVPDGPRKHHRGQREGFLELAAVQLSGQGRLLCRARHGAGSFLDPQALMTRSIRWLDYRFSASRLECPDLCFFVHFCSFVPIGRNFSMRSRKTPFSPGNCHDGWKNGPIVFF